MRGKSGSRRIPGIKVPPKKEKPNPGKQTKYNLKTAIGGALRGTFRSILTSMQVVRGLTGTSSKLTGVSNVARGWKKKIRALKKIQKGGRRNKGQIGKSIST